VLENKGRWVEVEFGESFPVGWGWVNEVLDADADAERLFSPEPEDAKETFIAGVVDCFPTLGRDPRERRLLEPLWRLGGAVIGSDTVY
jgi:hypothetical protein